MKKDNLKRIIKQFETLIEEFKSEVYSDKDSYVHPWDEHIKNTPRIINSEDDDGYADQIAGIANKNKEKQKTFNYQLFSLKIPIAIYRFKKQFIKKEIFNVSLT